MKKAILITVLIVILLSGASVVAYFWYVQPPIQSPDPPPMTPQAQTERITSYLLIRRIEELKDQAVYLQHREEGRRLIELTVGAEEEIEEENREENTETDEEDVIE